MSQSLSIVSLVYASAVLVVGQMMRWFRENVLTQTVITVDLWEQKSAPAYCQEPYVLMGLPHSSFFLFLKLVIFFSPAHCLCGPVLHWCNNLTHNAIIFISSPGRCVCALFSAELLIYCMATSILLCVAVRLWAYESSFTSALTDSRLNLNNQAFDAFYVKHGSASC